MGGRRGRGCGCGGRGALPSGRPGGRGRRAWWAATATATGAAAAAMVPESRPRCSMGGRGKREIWRRRGVVGALETSSTSAGGRLALRCELRLGTAMPVEKSSSTAGHHFHAGGNKANTNKARHNRTIHNAKDCKTCLSPAPTSWPSARYICDCQCGRK